MFTLTVMKCHFCFSVVFRCEVDVSVLKENTPQLFTCALDHCRVKVVFIVTLSTCSGVGITDLCTPPLDEGHERENLLQKYVGFYPSFNLKSSPDARVNKTRHTSKKTVSYWMIKTALIVFYCLFVCFSSVRVTRTRWRISGTSAFCRSKFSRLPIY